MFNYLKFYTNHNDNKYDETINDNNMNNNNKKNIVLKLEKSEEKLSKYFDLKFLSNNSHLNEKLFVVLIKNK